MTPESKGSSKDKFRKSSTQSTLARSKQQLDELPADTSGSEGNRAISQEDLKKRQKKTYSMALESVLAIEQMRVEVMRQGDNVSASDLVNEAVMLLLEKKELKL